MQLRCPSCSARLNAKPQLAGERVPCPKCGKKVLVPELDDLEEDEEDEETSTGRSRKLVYLQKNEASGADIPGTISLVLGIFALAAVAMGWFTHGWTYYAAVAIALVGFGLGFLGHGRLRIADCTLNFVILLPAVVISALLLAGMPVVKKGPTVTGNESRGDGPPIEVARVEEAGPEQSLPKIVWIDASKLEPIKIGKVLVRIGEVRLGVSKNVDIGKALENFDPNKVLESGNDGSVTEKPAIMIEVLVGNPSETIKLDFKPWSKAHGSDVARLTDNFNNPYKPLSSPASLLSMLGSTGTTTESIRPNATIADTLTFEEPVDKAKYLRLELPADNFGSRGVLHFQIPRSMIEPKR